MIYGTVAAYGVASPPQKHFGGSAIEIRGIGEIGQAFASVAMLWSKGPGEHGELVGVRGSPEFFELLPQPGAEHCEDADHVWAGGVAELGQLVGWRPDRTSDVLDLPLVDVDNLDEPLPKCTGADA